MKIDSFDNTLICEYDDLQTSLSYIKENRILSEEIERSIIKVIFNELGLYYDVDKEIKEHIELLPKQFVKNAVYDINNMFINNKVIDYNSIHLSYLMYYLPINTFKIWKPLLDLHIKSGLKRNMRILDIGTGPGSIPLGIIEFYKSLSISCPSIEFSLEFVLIDSEDCFIKLAKKMIEIIKTNIPSNLSINISNTICTKVTPESDYLNLETFDIITMSNFLTKNEKDNSENSYEIVSNFRNNLEENGSIIIIEPGDEDNCIKLKILRNKLINDRRFNLYSPCIGIWEEKDNYNCACFGMVRSYWEVPKLFDTFKREGLSKQLRQDIPFNYLVLRIDGLKKYQIVKNAQYFTKLSVLDTKINNIVNVIAFIRTTIYRESEVSIALCDGDCSFRGKYEGVWIKLSTNQLIKLGIDVKLVAGERVKLMKVNVIKTYDGILLEVIRQSKITIEY